MIAARFAAVVQAFPGASLLWYSKRIRCLAWKLRRDVVKDGEVTGFVNGWYEHQWTDADQDRYVVDVNAEITATDFDSIVHLCCERWNIETPAQLTLGVEP